MIPDMPIAMPVAEAGNLPSADIKNRDSNRKNRIAGGGFQVVR